jgi:hypothetical protein
LRGTGHRQQQWEFIKDGVFHLNSLPPYRYELHAFCCACGLHRGQNAAASAWRS